MPKPILEVLADIESRRQDPDIKNVFRNGNLSYKENMRGYSQEREGENTFNLTNQSSMGITSSFNTTQSGVINLEYASKGKTNNKGSTFGIDFNASDNNKRGNKDRYMKEEKDDNQRDQQEDIINSLTLNHYNANNYNKVQQRWLPTNYTSSSSTSYSQTSDIKQDHQKTQHDIMDTFQNNLDALINILDAIEDGHSITEGESFQNIDDCDQSDEQEPEIIKILLDKQKYILNLRRYYEKLQNDIKDKMTDLGITNISELQNPQRFYFSKSDDPSYSSGEVQKASITTASPITLEDLTSWM